MPFVPTILSPLDRVRAIGGILGLRVFQVTVRKRVWTFSGPRRVPGAPGSTKTDFDTVLTNESVDGTLQPVRVRQLKRSEVVSSGGRYAATDLRVGPMTPTYAATLLSTSGGQDDGAMNPAPSNSATEIIWIVATNDGGTHGVPAGGAICELKGEEATSLHYYAILRSTGRVPT